MAVTQRTQNQLYAQVVTEMQERGIIDKTGKLDPRSWSDLVGRFPVCQADVRHPPQPFLDCRADPSNFAAVALTWESEHKASPKASSAIPRLPGSDCY